MFKNIKDKKGYTLVEIIAAIVILGILILIAVPAINKQLNNFRLNYYKKLENSVVSASKDYVTDRRYSKPTKLFHSRVIKVSELEDEGYIDEVKDYLGKTCDNTDTSYSYVVVVKTGAKSYDYTTCLKCSQDEYATDTTGKQNNYCDMAWMTDDYIQYELNEDVGERLYVYYGTNEESIKDELKLTYDVVKKNNEGDELARKESDDENDALYPANIGELVGKNVNQIVNLRYVLPDGATLIKESIIYKHNQPKVEMYYGSNNIYSGKNENDVYTNGSDEWTNQLIVKMYYSDSDIEEVKQAIAIKDIEYYDAERKRWIETNCSVGSDNQSCTWTLKNDFNKEVKFRIVNERDKKGDGGDEFSIKVDVHNPDCSLISEGNVGDNEWYVGDVTFNFATKIDTYSGIGKYDLTAAQTQTFNNNATAVMNYDSKFQTYYGHVVDKAGNTKTCQLTVKRDATIPTCSVNPTGTIGDNEWFTSNVSISLSTEDLTSEVHSYDLSKIATPSYGKAASSTLTADTTGTKFYGYVKDNAGNVGTCEKTIKRDTKAPSCSIDSTGTTGANNWYTSNVSLSLSTEDETSKVSVYDLTTNTTATYNNATSATQSSDTVGTKFYGHVKDNAGLTGTCDITVKKDSTAPTKPVIDNPTNGEWTNKSFSLTLTSSDPVSGIEYWYYSYDQEEWTRYDKGTYDSYEKETYVTSPFSKERESIAYIKVCDKAGHCSTNSTWIRIDKTEPTCEVVPTGTEGLNEWFTSNVKVTLDIQDNGSEISQYGLSESSTIDYNSVTELNLSTDTTGKTYYGFVNDTAGNIATCQVTVKKDTKIPNCTITPTGTTGTNGWYTGDVAIKLTTSDATSEVLEYDLTTSSTASYKKATSLSLKNDTTGQKYYAYVKDKAGLTNKCEIEIKRDTKKPTCEVTPSGTKGKNDWYIGNVGIKLTYDDDTSEVIAYDLTNSSTASYAKTKTTDTLSTDVASKTYYGYVKDDAGHVNKCSVAVKRDTKVPTCTITPTGTPGENGWFKSDVDVKMTTDDETSKVAFYGMDTNSGVTYNNKTTGIVRKDTKGDIYYGVVEDNAGHTSTCQLTVRRDATAPKCSINPTGTKGLGSWFIGDVTIGLTYDDSTSEVNRYGLTTSATATYNSTKSLSLTTDTDGTKYYGYVKDTAGNTNTCDLNIYRDTKAPTCSIDATGTKGTNDWFISDVNLSLKREDATSKVATYDLTIYDVATYNDNATILVNEDTSGKTYYGYVKDNAGLTGKCSILVKRDVKAPTCEIQVTEGTEGNNGWYKSSTVKLKLVPDDATSQGLTTSTTASYSGTVTATISNDTDGITYYGYVKDDAGQTGTCSKKIMKDSKAPTCTITPTGKTGENGWYIGNVSLSLSTTDATSKVSTYDLTKNSAATFNKKDSESQTDDTTGQKFYGHVKDNAGNVGKCEIEIKKDIVAPVCYIEPSGVHSGDWYTGKVVVGLTTQKTTSEISTYGLTETSGTNYNKTTSLELNSDTAYAGKKYYGYVKSEAGLEGKCEESVKRDGTAPNKPVITNPNGDNWTNQNFALTVESDDGLSGLAKWYYSYETDSATSTVGWNEYANSSGIKKFTTTEFSAERNQLVYIKVCDIAGNCSVSSTMIKIDKDKPKCTLTPSGTIGNNGWYTTDVTLTLSTDAGTGSSISQTGISDAVGTKNYGTPQTTYILNSNFEDKYYYAHIKDAAGNENYCQTPSQIKRDATEPNCSFLVNGAAPITGWYTTGNAIAELQYSDNLSGVESFKTKKGTGSYSNTASQTVNTNTDNSGITVYGSVTDNAGNTKTCNVNIKRDTEPPTCTISSNGTTGTVTITVVPSGATGWLVTTSSSAPTSASGYDNDYDKTLTTDTDGTIYYGYVIDQAGLTGKCQTNVVRNSKVTISFNKNNNSATGTMASQECIKNNSCTLNENKFSLTGYSFAGWATSSTGNKVYDNKGSATFTGAATLYATWSANSYTVKFDGNGATGGSTANKSCTYDSSCKLTANGYTKTGHTFAGWATSASGNKAYNNSASVTNLTSSGTITLYAKWTPNVYNITYDANGGTNNSSNPSTYTYGVGVSSFYSPTKANYTFAGWYAGSTLVNNIPAQATGDMSLKATWTANKYTIAFDANGGTGTTSSVSCTYDSNCTLTSNGFSRSEYYYKGWSTSSTGSVEYSNGATVKNLASSGTKTLYAVWSPMYSWTYFDGTYCWTFAANNMGGGVNYDNGKLYLCTTLNDSSTCKVATSDRCNQLSDYGLKYFRLTLDP